MIDFELENVEVPDFNSEPFVLWLESVIVEEGFDLGEIAIVFCSDDYLLKINRDYLNHDYYTDIITFDYTEGSEINGDLFVSVDRVRENAEEFRTTFLEELKRVCVHGVLHLCGYKDKSPSEEGEMRVKENWYINKFVSRET